MVGGYGLFQKIPSFLEEEHGVYPQEAALAMVQSGLGLDAA